MMYCPKIQDDSPSTRTIVRSGLMHAVIEAMDKQFAKRLAPQPPAPQEATPANNRHDRRRAAALGRRGR